MPRVKLNQAVRLDAKTVSTCAELLDTGRAVVTKSEKWRNRKTPIYFCEVFNRETGETEGGWEISKYAYESRLAQSELTRKSAATPESKEHDPPSRLWLMVMEELISMRDGEVRNIMDWTIIRDGEKYDLCIEGEDLYTLAEAMGILAE